MNRVQKLSETQRAYQMVRTTDRIIIIPELYEQMKTTDNTLSLTLVQRMMEYCVVHHDGVLADNLYNDMQALRMINDRTLIEDYLLSRSEWCIQHGSYYDNIINPLLDRFKHYDQLLAAIPLNERTDNDIEKSTLVYTMVIRTLSYFGKQEYVMFVLGQLIERDMKPSFKLCAELWEQSLLDMNVKLLLLLSDWFIQNFEEQVLPEGCIVKMLHIGSGNSNSNLVRKCIQVYIIVYIIVYIVVYIIVYIIVYYI